MENASKALIIAGAIIISILVIGLGVFIFTGASENADVSSSMNSQKAQAHNGTFTNFFGQKVSASKVKELMKQIATNNITADTNEEKAYIYVYFQKTTNASQDAEGDGSVTTTQAVTADVRNGYTYRVNVTNDDIDDTDTVTSTSGVNSHSNGGNDAGYYNSGYIRAIRILENKKG